MPSLRRLRPARRITRADLTFVMAAFALVVAVTGITPAEAARAVKKVINADKVNGIAAAKSPTPGKLVPLDASGKFPASVLPAGGRGPRGEQGPAGPAGANGIGVDAASRVAFRAKPIAKQTTVVGSPNANTVQFGGEDFDPANAFDTSAAVFRAPVAGYYQFNTSIQLDWWSPSLPATRVLVVIKTDSAMVARGDDITGNLYQQPQASGLARLAKGETVTVGLYSDHERTIAAGSDTFFSGFLVAPL